ncbi:MAG: hypothetical protein RLZZ301_485 [Bacteroidota bacterium]|jgi:redox-sensitive bicupin YhaK (pirin superfamily)
MKLLFHSSSSRGHANHGWLDAKHSFSFASWYDPERIHFGALRVLNDDTVDPAMGFGMHPHDNMEIITIPLQGALKHRDSMGYSEIIEAGEVQVMSAGTGILHSEMNPSQTQPVSLFQIWIFPNQQQLEPRYAQRPYQLAANAFTELVGPLSSGINTYIHQDAWISIGTFDANETARYALKTPGNGVYLLLIQGEIQLENQILKPRDAVGITDCNAFELHCKQNSKLLVIEVPLEF